MTYLEQRIAESEALGKCNSLTLIGDYEAAYDALIAATEMAKGHDPHRYFLYEFLALDVFLTLMRFPASYVIKYLEQYSPKRNSYEEFLKTRRAWHGRNNEQEILDFMATNYPLEE